MITLIFEYLNEKIGIVIKGNEVLFGNTLQHLASTIDGLKLSKEGALKEYPDLESREDWREEIIKRFKEKIASFDTEDKKAKYIISDLTKFGYIPTIKQVKGHRWERI